ncbi:MAG: hypothetical protein V2I54_08265 [Bacteroidales bacterium]|jgi:hypothetical protein|nr:hypothetical protein [Bacteroidales bacterium]
MLNKEKIRILLPLLLFSVSFVFAQQSERRVSFSLKSGVTLANMYGPDVESKTFLIGSSSGTFYANHPASNRFKTGVNVGILADYS